MESLSTFFDSLKSLGRLVKNHLIGIVILVVLLASSFGVGAQYGQKKAATVYNQNQARLSQNDKQIDFSLFWKVWDIVSANYFDKSAIDPQKMFYGAISGMVASLGDPYTTFLPPTENKQVNDDLSGKFEGVGIELGYKDNALAVVAPLDDTPAQKAGIMPGDYITKINDKETDGMSLPEAVNAIRGPKGSHVKLELFRKGQDKPFTVDLVRSTIVVKSVTYSQKEGGIGYIKLSKFGEETNNEWDAAIEQARAQGVKVLIVDVRNNPGGFMQSAVYTASEFLTGTVVKQENSDGTTQTYNAIRRGQFLQLPLVVLINGGSASSSEIFAGALQSNGRAKLVGEQSFGKGTIQEVENFDDSGAGLHITRARWLLPNGQWIHKKGLTPDVVVGLTSDDIKAGKDPQLDKALELARSAIK